LHLQQLPLDAWHPGKGEYAALLQEHHPGSEFTSRLLKRIRDYQATQQGAALRPQQQQQQQQQAPVQAQSPISTQQVHQQLSQALGEAARALQTADLLKVGAIDGVWPSKASG
jgi:hypothetical protein